VLEAEQLAALSIDNLHADHTATDLATSHPAIITKSNKKTLASHKPVQRTKTTAKRAKTIHHTAVAMEKKAISYRSLKLASLNTAPAHDLQRGHQLAQKCLLCHNMKPGQKKKFGPALFAVLDQPAGKSEHYNYSRSLAKANFTWNEENLAQWICHSGKSIKQLTGKKNARTNMANQRICGQDAKNVVAYLRTVQTSNSSASPRNATASNSLTASRSLHITGAI